jgi:curli biogenesis system outer membrane secretion channel CsgG
MKKYPNIKLFSLILFLVYVTSAWAIEWYKSYENGLAAMRNQDYKTAAEQFRLAILNNPNENKKVRTYGMHFIEYYPHRELGICLYNLGENAEALRELQLSNQQAPSARADEYIRQASANAPPPKAAIVAPAVITQVATQPLDNPPNDNNLIIGKKTIKEVGERMGVAVMPFLNKGASRDLGEIVLDKMITVLWNQQRFKVMERAQLDKILAEQSLGASGVVDAATAAQIGKGIGVDAIIIGSVAAAASGAISIDARVIDTESATIIVAQDAYSGSSDAQSVKNAVENLSRKIAESLPLVEGYIIRIDGEKIMLDQGRGAGLKRGMKCVVYKEGEVVKHPITGEVLGKDTQELGEIIVTEDFDKYSVAKTLKIYGGVISIGDKFITK